MNNQEFDKLARSLKKSSQELALLTAEQKNKALSAVADSLLAHKANILEANNKDLERSRAAGMSEALLERLMLNSSRIDSIVTSINDIISQTDPLGEVTAGWSTKGGLQIRQVRVPLGVVAIIYESRPNVTVDAFCLAFKSGNSILLRGSASAEDSNKAITTAIKEGLAKAGSQLGLSWMKDTIELCEPEKDHSDVDLILSARGKIDCVLPRGGAKLIQRVVQNAKVPVIETGAGICHLFVDSSADLQKAAKIAENAKIQRPGACNAIETILVHTAVAEQFLPMLEETLAGRVELRCDKVSYEILEKTAKYPQKIQQAKDEDFGFEFLDLVCAVKIVADVNEAISYINEHSTKHSETICTESRANARAFQSRIDSACVYVNASTRFSDGGEFGFGAEVGISTQKLHARGPMGIKALTTTKFLIDGDGQIR